MERVWLQQNFTPFPPQTWDQAAQHINISPMVKGTAAGSDKKSRLTPGTGRRVALAKENREEEAGEKPLTLPDLQVQEGNSCDLPF